MAQPAPKTTADAKVSIDKHGGLTISTGTIRVVNGRTTTIAFTYPSTSGSECELKLTFHKYKTSPAGDEGTVVVSS